MNMDFLIFSVLSSSLFGFAATTLCACEYGSDTPVQRRRAVLIGVFTAVASLIIGLIIKVYS